MGTYEIINVKEDREDKISLVVSFNGRASELYEVDFSCLAADLVTLNAELSGVVEDTVSLAAEYEQLCTTISEERSEQVLSVLRGLQEDLFKRFQHKSERKTSLLARIAEVEQTRSDRDAYVNSVLQEVSDTVEAGNLVA